VKGGERARTRLFALHSDPAGTSWYIMACKRIDDIDVLPLLKKIVTKRENITPREGGATA